MKNEKNDSAKETAKKAAKEAREKADSMFKKCLAALGLRYSLLLQCFTHLASMEAQRMEMLHKIPGGIEIWATLSMGMRSMSRVDELYRRMFMRQAADSVRRSLAVGSDEIGSNYQGMNDLIDQLVKLNKRLRGIPTDGEDALNEEQPGVPELTPLSPSMLRDRTAKTLRKNLVNSFRIAHYDSKESNAVPGMARVISHWRGLLDAYRVSLRLDGKHEYPPMVQHGDLFLKVMQAEAQPVRIVEKLRGPVKRNYKTTKS
jgi:hypothetical protein